MAGQRSFKLWLLHLRWSNLKTRFYNIVNHQVIEIKEKPSRVALGCAVGLGVNFFPTFGLGFLFAFILATVLRGNQVSATATSLLTGPLIPLKYALNLLVGGLIQAHGTETDLVELIVRQYSLIFKIGGFREQLLSFLDFFGSTFIVGALINATVFGTGFYFGVDFILRKKLSKIPPR